jgi:hypothetical protein
MSLVHYDVPVMSYPTREFPLWKTTLDLLKHLNTETVPLKLLAIGLTARGNIGNTSFTIRSGSSDDLSKFGIRFSAVWLMHGYSVTGAYYHYKLIMINRRSSNSCHVVVYNTLHYIMTGGF